MFLYAVGGSLVGQMLVVYFPPLQRIFQTEALTVVDLLTLFSIASTVLILDEVRKFFLRRRHRNKTKYDKLNELV